MGLEEEVRDVVCCGVL